MKTLIIALLAIYVSFDIARHFYTGNIVISALNISEAQVHWFLNVARIIVLQSAASLAIFMSIWNYSRATNKLLAGLAIVISIGFPSAYSFVTYSGLQATNQHRDEKFTISNNIEAVSKNITRILESDSDSIVEKIESSKLYASMVYIKSGKIIDVIDQNGKLTPLTPDRRTLEKRNQFIENESKIKNLNNTLKASLKDWLSILLGSTLAGLLAVQLRKRVNGLHTYH